MKIKSNVYYIKEDKWADFLKIAESKFNFCEDTRYIYPKYIVRTCAVGEIRIGISAPCVNIWDGEDKNGSREVHIWIGKVGNYNKKYIAPYIQDLINEGYVE